MATSDSRLHYTGLFERRLEQLSVPLPIDSYRWYRHMQTSHPVYFDTTRAAWLVFRYDDVQRVLLDTATFSSLRTVNSDGIIDPLNNLSILGTDPPDHRQLRTSMAQAFTPTTITALEPRITSIVDTLLDQVQGKGEMDIVDDLAFPIPNTVIAELLGVRSTDRN